VHVTAWVFFDLAGYLRWRLSREFNRRSSRELSRRLIRGLG
jgi:hypothetical protein